MSVTVVPEVGASGGSGSGGSSGSNPVGSGNFATARPSVGAITPTVLAAARTGAPGTGRIAVTVYNQTGVLIYVGPTAASQTTWIPLPVGGTLTIPTTASVSAVTLSGSSTVAVVETY